MLYKGMKAVLSYCKTLLLRSDSVGELAQNKLLQIIYDAYCSGEQSAVATMVQKCAQKVVMTGVAAGEQSEILSQDVLYQSNILRLAGTILPNNTSDSIPEIIMDEIERMDCKFDGQPERVSDAWGRKDIPKSRIAYKGSVANTCPEHAAVFAANRLGYDCEFTDFRPHLAGQLDIFPPLAKHATPSMRDMLFVGEIMLIQSLST